MRVDVSGYKFIFPRQCACCGAIPQTTLTAWASKSTGTRVVHTTSKSWDFPYCNQCTHHVRAARKAVTTSRFMTIVSLVVAGYFYFCTSALDIGLIVGIGGTASAIFTYIYLMAKAKGMCSPHCACVWMAVGYLGWYGTLQKFEFVSSEYALAFMVANQSKLVNVRPEVWQWLHANGYGASPYQPQSARRYMS
jgi:hypothetical protein